MNNVFSAVMYSPQCDRRLGGCCHPRSMYKSCTGPVTFDKRNILGVRSVIVC